MRTIATLLLVVGLAAYGVYLGSANLDPHVTLELGITSLDLPLWQAVFGSLLIGAAIVFFAFAWPVIRMRLQVRRQARRIRELEQEIHGLRTLPLSEDKSAAPATAQEG